MSPFMTYRTDFSNEVHQLVVSVSRHCWVTREGAIRYQKKPFERSLANLARTEKQHVVHYLIRDHFSGLFYAEIAPSRQLFSAREFLLRAWSRKDRVSFCGVPAAITLPRTVADEFPELTPYLVGLRVEIIPATSGFQAGVRDLKTWEEHLRYSLWWYANHNLARLPALTEKMVLQLSEEYDREHADRWRSGIRTLRFPTTDEPLQLVPGDWRKDVETQYREKLHSIGT